MQIQKIQQNNYNTCFGAKIEVKGFIDDIGEKTIKSWENRAANIGTDSNLITLDFGMPFYKTGRGQIRLKKVRNISAYAEINDKKYQMQTLISAENTRKLYDSMKNKVSEFLDTLAK